MPESVTDRPTKSHEYIFLMSKSANYFYDHEIIKEPAVYGTQDIRGSQGRSGHHKKPKEKIKFEVRLMENMGRNPLELFARKGINARFGL